MEDDIIHGNSVNKNRESVQGGERKAQESESALEHGAGRSQETDVVVASLRGEEEREVVAALGDEDGADMRDVEDCPQSVVPHLEVYKRTIGVIHFVVSIVDQVELRCHVARVPDVHSRGLPRQQVHPGGTVAREEGQRHNVDIVDVCGVVAVGRGVDSVLEGGSEVIGALEGRILGLSAVVACAIAAVVVDATRFEAVDELVLVRSHLDDLLGRGSCYRYCN